MVNAIEQLMNSLNDLFAPMDAEVAEKSQIWAKGRVEAIREFKANNSARVMGQEAYYAELFRIAGGKTWYNAFDGRSSDDIEQIVAKNCKAVAEARNVSIIKKLVKAEVTELVDVVYNHTNDGFNGVFVVETNKGRKKVTIETIRAGGYNIQCLHLRVLVKVK